MENPKQLANRLREVVLNGRWIANTNLRDQLSEVTLEQGVKPVKNLNTLAALTFHVNYYLAGILEVFTGGDLTIRDKYSFDLPPLETEEDWNQLKQGLWDNAESFAQHVEGMSEEMLASPFVDEKYGDYRRNIEGMIEHCYYHLGQVSLIRKLLVTTED